MNQRVGESLADFQGAKEDLYYHLASLNSYLKTNASNSKMIRVLQENPCLLKCENDIKNTTYDDVDPIYGDRHDYAQKKMTDAIRHSLGTEVIVKCEHYVSTGKIDILVSLKHKEKTIFVELKTGIHINFFQIMRYLYEADTLIILVRVSTQEVLRINNTSIMNELMHDISSLNEKVEDMLNNKRDKVQEEWCKGCTAICQFRKKYANNTSNSALFGDFTSFIRSVNAIIPQTINT